MDEFYIKPFAYAKIILHAAKYPFCAINGVLLADGTKLKDGAIDQDLDIVDAVPLFHRDHYCSPISKVALSQIDAVFQEDSENVIVGYYAACENFTDNTVEKCPGPKITEKIVENFPSAVFIVVDNTKVIQYLQPPAIKIYKYSDGEWKLKDVSQMLIQTPFVRQAISLLIRANAQDDLVDFDNYFDYLAQDSTELVDENVFASVNASIPLVAGKRRRIN